MEILTLMGRTEKITDDTEFDYYYSETADEIYGHSFVGEIKYTERVRTKRGGPVNEYDDLVIVLEKYKPWRNL